MSQPPNLLSRIFGFVAGAVVLVLAFVFSVAVFAVLLVTVLVILGIFWWKTHSLRRAQRGTIIEATEYREVYEETPERPAIEGESKREPSRDE